mmetsp:Transcript_51404/g.76894  ORF Transcript_51404/g.76894 Transcript_51404/m.76894 type:complete len:131 (+) Transcript_51404:280-672(+)
MSARGRGREVIDCASCGGAMLIPRDDVVIFAKNMTRTFNTKCRTCSWQGRATAPLTGMSWEARDKLYQSIIWGEEKNSDWKSCPSCTELINKNGGCSHMKCGYCGCRFDWNDAQAITNVKKKHLGLKGKF